MLNNYKVFLILVPPTNIQILNHLSGSRIEIKENEEVEIACKVSNAKPRARILWYRNNVAFNPGLGKIDCSKIIGAATNFLSTKLCCNSKLVYVEDIQ